MIETGRFQSVGSPAVFLCLSSLTSLYLKSLSDFIAFGNMSGFLSLSFMKTHGAISLSLLEIHQTFEEPVKEDEEWEK